MDSCFSRQVPLTIDCSAPLEKGSKLEELVTKIRVRKGLKVCQHTRVALRRLLI